MSLKLKAIFSGQTPMEWGRGGSNDASIKLILDLSISKLLDKDGEAVDSFTAC